MKILSHLFFLTAFLTGFPSLSFSQTDTPVTVRVLSRDAKLIGSSMGGVEIVIRDKSTGAEKITVTLDY